MTTIQANVGTVSIHNDPNPGLATLAGSFHHIWRSEMAAWVFLTVMTALAIYLICRENPAKEE